MCFGGCYTAEWGSCFSLVLNTTGTKLNIQRANVRDKVEIGSGLKVGNFARHGKF